MTIHLARHYGLCFGVRDALAHADRLLDAPNPGPASSAQPPLTILGELVHNPVARERLAAKGAREGDLHDFESAAPTGRVLITAHGAADERRAAWRAAGFAVEDATCPLVRRAHRVLAGLVASGFHPVVIGRHGHAETRGLTGDFPGATILESEADLASLPAGPQRFGVIAQTTQPPDGVRQLVEALRAARPESETRFCDTVCQPTKDRQSALRELIEGTDVVVVVGGKNSHNTRQLALAAESAGRRVHQIERVGELRAEWFFPGERVGLTAGTSTLPDTVDAVRARLEEIAAERGPGVPARTALASDLL